MNPNPLPGLLQWALQGQLRHVMTLLGGILLAKGFFPNQGAEAQFIQWGISGGLIMAGMVWSFLEKKEISATVAPAASGS